MFTAVAAFGLFVDVGFVEGVEIDRAGRLPVWGCVTLIDCGY